MSQLEIAAPKSGRQCMRRHRRRDRGTLRRDMYTTDRGAKTVYEPAARIFITKKEPVLPQNGPTRRSTWTFAFSGDIKAQRACPH